MMRIKIGRLKQIIQEELDSFKKLEEINPAPGSEEVEALGPDAHVASAEQTELILDDLRDILEEWEETEYESDEQRWQAYAQDIQDLVDEYSAASDAEGEDEDEGVPAAEEDETISEAKEELMDIIKQSIYEMFGAPEQQSEDK